MPVVVGGVADVAPAPCPDAPVVPGLPVPVVSVGLSCVVPLVAEPAPVEPVAELPPVPLPLVSVALHAARDSVIMLVTRRFRTVLIIISLKIGTS